MIKSLSSLIAACCLIGGSTAFADSKEISPRPNVVLIFVDDMGIGDMSAYQSFTKLDDSVQMHTPNMDTLSKQGTLFTDAHTAATLCSPSRWALHCGKHSWRRKDVMHRLLHSNDKCFLRREKTMAAMFKRAGYRTYGVGKWHLGLVVKGKGIIEEGPLQYGFDHFFGQAQNPGMEQSPPFMDDDKFVTVGEEGKLVTLSEAKKNEKKNGSWNCSEYGQNYLNYFRKFAVECSPAGEHKDKPFFIFFSPNSNHTPYFPAKAIDGVPVIGQARTVSGENAGPKLGPLHDDYRNDQQKYRITHDPNKRADMIHENDLVVGRMVAWLKETDDPRNPGHKMFENTLIVFTSDNGSDVRLHNVPAHGHLSGHKRTQYDGGHRVPFCAVWPGHIPAGKTNNQPLSVVDLFATFAHAIGQPLELSEGPDSENILNQMLNPDARLQRVKPVISFGGSAIPLGTVNGKRKAAGGNHLSMRSGSLKLSFGGVNFKTGDAKPIGLFDFSKATKETVKKNLLGNPKYAPLVKEMREKLKAYITTGKVRK